MKVLTLLLQQKKILLYLSIIFLNILLGFAIVKQNFYLIFIIIGSIFVLIIIKSTIIPIAAILLIISFAGWGVDQGYIPMQIMWLPELLSLMIFIKALLFCIINRTKFKLFGIKLVLSFLILSIVSLLYNGVDFISGILFLRILFRYYLLFLAIINLDMDEKSTKILNNILIFIFISQLPLSIIKLLIYDQGERPLGLSSHSLPTIIPLIAIGFLLSFYYFFKNKKIYLLGIVGFIGFSIIGAKRGFIFFLPIVLVYVFWKLRDRLNIRLKHVLPALLVLVLSFYTTVRLIPTLNPERRTGGTFDVSYLFNYGYNYTTRINDEGLATGRSSATIAMINGLYKGGPISILIGFGPGSILKSMFNSFNLQGEIYQEFGVSYGVNGISWLIVQVGFLGLVFFSLLLYLILRKSDFLFNQEKDAYWRSFGMGVSIFSFELLVISLLYSPFFQADSISSFFFCLAGFVVARCEKVNNDTLQQDIKE